MWVGGGEVRREEVRAEQGVFHGGGPCLKFSVKVAKYEGGAFVMVSLVGREEVIPEGVLYVRRTRRSGGVSGEKGDGWGGM